MTDQHAKSARNIAALTLNRFDTEKSAFAAQILDDLLPQTNQKQHATELVLATLRNRSVIDMIIAQLADCPVSRIPPKLRNIIRIGAYELIYCPQTAEYAIINEATENAKAVAKGKKQIGFVNALLRQIQRHIKNRQITLADSDPQNTLPQNTLNGCQFDIALLPKPADSPDEYFNKAFSLPRWLITDWLTEFGFDKTRQICFADNRNPGLYLRVNKLKTTTEKLAENFRKADVNFDITPDKKMLRLKRPGPITQLPGFSDGAFTVQDITASSAVKLLNPQPGWTILDLCAAPGTKTTQLAEATNDKAIILATDIDNQRLQKVQENIYRLSISSVKIIAYENLQKAASEFGPFDVVLLDVPCSNTGVLARRPETRYRLRPATIKTMAKTQYKLLETASAMLKPNGKICYSTCSIQPDENSNLVNNFLLQNKQLKLSSEQLTLPSAENFDRDGGYAAILTAS